MTKTIKDPLMKISKRQNLALGYKLLLTVGAILLSLVLGGILLACLGYNPIDFYVQMMMGNFKNASYATLLIQALIPLLITSLGVSLAFKMRFWNIGAEGQFIVGAICAMTFSLLIGDSVPSPLGTIIIVLSGAVGGGIYAVIVALLKVKFNTNETLMTLMLNYVALYLASYMLKTDFYANQGVGVPTFKIIAKALWLTEIDIGKFSFDTAVFIAVALVIILFLYFKQSKQGYELNVVGDSPNTAKYAGMKVKWIIVRTMLFSGAIIGLAGALKLCGSGAGHTFSANITGGVGWTSIIVAWLAKLNPIGILIASLLMSILERGCSFARTSLGISDSMSDVLQGIILFTVLASDFFINYKITFRKKVKDAVAVQDAEVAETASVSDENTDEAGDSGESSDLSSEQSSVVFYVEESVTDEIKEEAQPVAEETDKRPAETPPKEKTDEDAIKEADDIPAKEDATPLSESVVNEKTEDKEEIKKEEDDIPAPQPETKEEADESSVSKTETTEKPAVKKSKAKKTAAKKPAAKTATAKAPAKKTTVKKEGEKATSQVKKPAAKKATGAKTSGPSDTAKKAAKTTVKAEKTTKTAGKTTAKSQAKTSRSKSNGKGGNGNE